MASCCTSALAQQAVHDARVGLEGRLQLLQARRAPATRRPGARMQPARRLRRCHALFMAAILARGGAWCGSGVIRAMSSNAPFPRPWLTPANLLRASVGVALLTITLKTLAWYVTGSVGLLSDAMESFVNLASAVFALAMVTVAQLPRR
jgi:hypothetical protein